MLATNAAPTHPTRFERSIEREIVLRTGGQVHDFRVEIGETRVTIRGITWSYYGKQLAIQAVMKLFEGTGLVPVMEIDVRERTPRR